MTDLSRLKQLLELWYRNELYRAKKSPLKLEDNQRDFLSGAINAELKLLGMDHEPPEVTSPVRSTVEELEPGLYSDGELDEFQKRSAAEVQKHMEAVRSTIRSQGLRWLRCTETDWGPMNAGEAIKQHIHKGSTGRARSFPSWYNAQKESPYEEPRRTYTPADAKGVYDFFFVVNPVAGNMTSEPR
ncbi:MAG: hypothetical protein ACPIOQ_07875, partial [Promethearchaeia archaeon]